MEKKQPSKTVAKFEVVESDDDEPVEIPVPVDELEHEQEVHRLVNYVYQHVEHQLMVDQIVGELASSFLLVSGFYRITSLKSQKY